MVVLMYAKLKDQNLEKIKSLEKELGVYLLATPKYKNLSAEELKAVNELEKKLGSVLIAYEA